MNDTKNAISYKIRFRFILLTFFLPSIVNSTFVSRYPKIIGGNKSESLNVSCSSTGDEPCFVVKLSDTDFAFVDCTVVNENLPICNLSLLGSLGKVKSSFNTTFTHDKSTNKIPKDRINRVDKIERSPGDGNISVTGRFQSESIDGISEVERDFCVNEECIDYAGAAFEGVLIFNPDGKVVNFKINRPAKPLYSRDQIDEKLREIRENISLED